MTPKEYLNQIRLYDFKINAMLEEKERLKSLAESCTAAINEKIQTSSTSEVAGFQDNVAKIIDLEREITKEIDKYIDLKRDIKNILSRVDNAEYYEILYKRYFEYKKLMEIALELHRSYPHMKRLHGYALENFKKYMNDDTQ